MKLELTSLLNVKKDHNIVSIDVKLRRIVGEEVLVAEATWDALESESRARSLDPDIPIHNIPNAIPATLRRGEGSERKSLGDPR